MASETIPVRRPKRERQGSHAGLYDVSSSEEARLLKAALESSVLEQRVETARIPECPVFTPTLEEWSRPLEFLYKIAPVGHRHWIVKIVPPAGWRPPCGTTKHMASHGQPAQGQRGEPQRLSPRSSL